MTERRAPEVPDAGDSAVARQLRAGFPWLRFESELEWQFRDHSVRSSLPQIRRNLVVSGVMVFAFGCLNALLLGGATGSPASLIQFGLLLPLVAAVIALTHLPDAHRIYLTVASVLAPAFGLLVVAVESTAVRNGAPLVFASVLLTALSLYFLVGLLFFQAIAVNAVIWIGYMIVGSAGSAPTRALVYNVLVLLIGNVVGGLVAYGIEADKRKQFLEQRLLAEAAARDGLTGLYNRRMFDERLEAMWSLAQREGTTLALMMVDIDCFKQFNDCHGHQAGDDCLRQIGAVLGRAARRPLDFVARYGGEEFALVLYAPDHRYLHEVSTRLHSTVAALALPHGDSPLGPLVTISVGVAYVEPTHRRSPQGFVQLADEALYQAKTDGRNRSVFSDSAYGALVTGIFRMPRRAGASAAPARDLRRPV